MVGAYSFSQPCLYIQPSLQSSPKFRSSTTVDFHLPISHLFVHKIILANPTNTSFLYTSVILQLLIFAYHLPNNLYPKYFFILVIESIHCVPRNREARKSCEDWHCFTFFFKVWTVITGLTIIDHLSLKLRKLVHCRN